MFFPALSLSIIVMPFFISKQTDIIGWVGFFVTVIQMISFIIIIYLTEKTLKKKFDENGNTR